MKRPDFTPEEERLIAYYTLFSKGTRLWQELPYPLLATVLVGLGMLLERFEFVYVGFGILLFLKAYELFQSGKWTSVYRNTLLKYEEAFQQEDTPEGFEEN